MLVLMKDSGCVEDLIDDVARGFILLGRAEAYRPVTEGILKAEEQGGPAATVGIEVAMLEPKAEHAVARLFRKYVRMPRSRG